MIKYAHTDRRTFLRRGAIGAGAIWTASLSGLMVRQAGGSPLAPSPYGAIGPVADETTGLPLLQLPRGFRYKSFGWTGDVMSDGATTPGAHDGMAVIDEIHDRDDRDDEDEDDRGGSRGHKKNDDDDGDDRSGRLLLVRNHEPAVGAPYLTNPAITFANDGAGGTTNPCESFCK